MAWDEVIAGLLGGLEGGVQGWQTGRRLKQQERDRQAQEERQARQDALAEQDRADRAANREEQRRDRAQRDTESMLTQVGRGGTLSSEQASRARDLDLGHRVEDAPDFQHSYFRQAGPMPLMVPEVMSRVAPTGAERKADQVAAEKKRADDAARVALDNAIKNLPQHLQGPAQFGEASGKMPTLGAADFVSPETRTQQATAAAVEREKALVPIRLRQREGEKAIDQRFDRVPAPLRDDPAMPQGVRAYLGDLVSRYQSDPAAARAELQRAAPNLLRDHPNLDLLKVTQQMNAMLPLPQLTDEEKAAAAAQRAAPKPVLPPVVPAGQAPPAAQVPIPMAGAPRPDARVAQASALMKQIQQGRAQGRDTAALEQQLLALKRGANAAGVH
jgi:hypothetical protein